MQQIFSEAVSYQKNLLREYLNASFDNAIAQTIEDPLLKAKQIEMSKYKILDLELDANFQEQFSDKVLLLKQVRTLKLVLFFLKGGILLIFNKKTKSMAFDNTNDEVTAVDFNPTTNDFVLAHPNGVLSFLKWSNNGITHPEKRPLEGFTFKRCLSVKYALSNDIIILVTNDKSAELLIRTPGSQYRFKFFPLISRK